MDTLEGEILRWKLRQVEYLATILKEKAFFPKIRDSDSKLYNRSLKLEVHNHLNFQA